jgi:hypothetical protein
MYIFGGLTVLMFIFLYIISRTEKSSYQGGKMFTPFVKMAALLYRKAVEWRMPLFRSISVDKALKELSPDKSVTELRIAYYTGKVGFMLCLLFLGTGLAVGVKYQSDQLRKLEKGTILYRSEYGDSIETIRLEARINGDISQEVELNVPVRRLTKEEANSLQAQYWNILRENILQQCTEDGYVTGDIRLETESMEYPFFVNWISSDPKRLTRDGRVGTVTEPTDVRLTAVLTYLPPEETIEEEPLSENDFSQKEPTDKLEWEHFLTVHLNLPVRTREETIAIKLKELLRTTGRDSQTQSTWELPGTLDGEQIEWVEKPEDFSHLVLGIVFGTTLLIYIFSDRDLQGKVARRRSSLQEAYPLIVNKLILYLGAGLTLRGAYQKIAQQYQDKFERSRISHPAYDEIVYTCHEINAGVPESTAYENFGKRSGVIAYVKLNALLIQNLRKGSRTLLERLRKEGELALSESMQRQRKMGEEAGTKLLVPMIMMLGVVMILVMIPAFSSFGT